MTLIKNDCIRETECIHKEELGAVPGNGTKIKLPFGINENNTIIHVADVERGKKCNCVCPSCRVPLIAAKGSKKQHHFKHATGNECEHGLESAIHLAAKQKIIEKKQITLPKYIYIASATDSRGFKHKESKNFLSHEKIILFDSMQEEKELYGMKVDILAKKGNNLLIIEIFYRHKVDDQKIEKIKNANISAIEIDLSDLMTEDVEDSEAFWSYINDPKHVQWLHNAKAHTTIYPELINQLAVKVQKQEKEYVNIDKVEKAALIQALNNIKMLRRKKHIAQYLNQKVKTDPILQIHSKELQISLDDLPNFLNLDVIDGNWIFKCDRRIWQTAVYNRFIHKNHAQFFCVNEVNSWFKGLYSIGIPRNLETLERCSKLYPELVPADVLSNIPSSLKTLRAYFNQLCELGMLELIDDSNDNYSFKILSKNPNSELCR